MTAEFNDRVALVTGATEGIGQGIVTALLTRGATVYFTGVDEQSARAMAADLSAGRFLQFFPVDGTIPGAIDTPVEGVLDRHGRIDILVNNLSGPSYPFTPVHEMTNVGWDDAIARNLSSAFWAIRRVLPSMMEQGRGRIINMSSLEAKNPRAAGIASYTAAKHGLTGLTKAVSYEYARYGITCNAVCPGMLDLPGRRETRVAAAAANGISYEDVEARYLDETATKRFPTIESVVAVVLLLASDAAADITGANWSVDGGIAQI